MITVEYLPGTLIMEADHQSRSATDSGDWNPDPFIFKKIGKAFWTPDIDLFTSKISNHLPTYLAWRPDPFSKGANVFQLSWGNPKGYTFPQFCLIQPV